MIRICQIKLPIESNIEKLRIKISKLLGINQKEILDIQYVKKSLDARNKNNLLYVYEVDVLVDNEDIILKKKKSNTIFKTPDLSYHFSITGEEKLNTRPVIIGTGPAGLFCAYLLAENGYHPLILERGGTVEDRVKAINQFWKNGVLDKDCNVQFGEGGAGTFSDGKLNTLIKDKANRGKKVFEIFVENGASEEIMYVHKPHIGTDLLRKVIVNIRNKIISMGGEFRFNTCLTDLSVVDNKIVSIEVNHKEIIPCEVLVLAIGHSARDTFRMLYNKKMHMLPKSFAVGVRIEHPQDMINISQYGANYKKLGPASYKLTYTTSKGRGVYSFCMCPGGYVINASSEDNHLVVNGMSDYKRDTKNAHIGFVVTVNTDDFGTQTLDGLEFQRKLEKNAYIQGKGKIPVQLYKDFKNNKVSSHFGEIKPITKGEYNFANLNTILPDFIIESLKEAIPVFGRKIAGFDREDAILLGVESRTSSPVRIVRDENGVSNILGVYPCGEGSGYAGGITTAAIDGVKVAENIAKIYHL